MISPFVRKSLALGARTGPAELVLLSATGGTGGIGVGGVAVACNEGTGRLVCAPVKHSKTHHFSQQPDLLGLQTPASNACAMRRALRR